MTKKKKKPLKVKGHNTNEHLKFLTKVGNDLEAELCLRGERYIDLSLKRACQFDK